MHVPVYFLSYFPSVSSGHLLSEWPSVSSGVSVGVCTCISGSTGFKHTLAGNLGYYPDVGFMGAYLCDIALNGVWYGNHPDYLYLGANKQRTVFGGICMLANGIS